ncbi:MAG: hypothetical protein GTO45_16305 [Candidatus Aminicenantes bacterium]|nr:hypothetical protein [Candidatus Aminicenantes bacterium]NIM78264.1 hypothetical protein [Candidatus Aminicenantes bacterium]NIN19689.1 hypothetical protein [Candidatus Aminicenantes bacterium]NIN43571.1 hypothetical protein [Candidatus Aminicenantes bacterium]NIN86316.1 hypothetical protein [Candidatus Aminicenantes bacterium]
MFDDSNLRNRHKKAVITAAAIMITPLIYVVVAELFLINIEFGDMVFPLYRKLRYFLWAAAAIDVIVMSIVKNLIISGEIKINTSKAQFHGKIDDQSKRDPENEFIQRLYRALVISFACWEAIAMIGFLLFLLGKDRTEFYAFIGISLFLMLVHFPKYDDWEGRLKDFLSE